MKQVIIIELNLSGREINFFSDSHLAPKFIKVVADSKKIGRHFERQTKPFFYAVIVLEIKLRKRSGTLSIFINHCYSTLILFSFLFRKEQYITKMKSNKLSSNWSSSFRSLTHHQKTYPQKMWPQLWLMLLLKRLLWQVPLSVIKLKKCMILSNSSIQG